MPVVVAGNYRVRPPKPKQEWRGGGTTAFVRKGALCIFGVGEWVKT